MRGAVEDGSRVLTGMTMQRAHGSRARYGEAQVAAPVAATPPFILAHFTGTGTLTGYTPDTGLAFKAPSTSNVFDGTFLHGLSDTAMLAYAERVSDGSWKLLATGNPWAVDDYFLYSPTVVPSADHFMETTLILDAAQALQWIGHEHRTIRGVGGDAAYLDCIGMRFTVDQSDATHRTVNVFGDYRADRAAAPAVSITNEVAVATVPVDIGANGSVKLRSEIEGSSMRGFVDNVLVYTCDFVHSTYYAAAGKCAWSFQFEGTTPYSKTAIDKLQAGVDFL